MSAPSGRKRGQAANAGNGRSAEPGPGEGTAEGADGARPGRSLPTSGQTGLRRFWREARAAPADGGGWQVLLDGRPLHTPGKALLVLPGRALAELVAKEWAAQGERIEPSGMPATRMANAALDRVAPQRAAVVELVAAYGASDLLCYRAEAPLALARRQQAWDTPLDWAAQALGARLRVTQGVMPVAQPAEALARLSAAVARLPALELAPLHDLVALSGSLVLGLAVAGQALAPATAWALSRLDETYESEIWGRDAEAEAVAGAREAAFHFALRFLLAARQADR